MTKFIINKSDIIHNCNEINSHTDALLIPTLKANCYGLGAKEVMDILHSECNINLFAVSRLGEAVELMNKECDILLLSCYHDEESIKQIIDNDIICAVDSLEQVKLISEYAKSQNKICRVHIKIDTGFGRFGFSPENVSEIKEIYSFENIKAEGIFSHFSNAFGNIKDTDRQFDMFMSVVNILENSGIDVGIRHIANSSAFARDTKYHLDAVRVGSLLLGRLPMSHSLSVKRVGRFETDIVELREMKKGSNIGYGNVYKLKKDTTVAVLCAGSADGILIKKDYDTYRIFDLIRYGVGVLKMFLKDNRIDVIVCGKRTKTVGRIALTHTMVDVTGIDCKCGDKAVIELSPLYIADKVEREYV